MVRVNLMATVLFWHGFDNIFFSFGTKNMVRVNLMATVLFWHGFYAGEIQK